MKVTAVWFWQNIAEMQGILTDKWNRSRRITVITVMGWKNYEMQITNLSKLEIDFVDWQEWILAFREFQDL